MSGIFPNYKKILDGKVPYTGAVSNVNLGSFGITANSFAVGATSFFEVDTLFGGNHLRNESTLTFGCIDNTNTVIGGIVQTFLKTNATLGGAVRIRAGEDKTNNTFGKIYLETSDATTTSPIGFFSLDGLELYSTWKGAYFHFGANDGFFAVDQNVVIAGDPGYSSFLANLAIVDTASIPAGDYIIACTDAFSNQKFTVDDGGNVYAQTSFFTGGAITANQGATIGSGLGLGQQFNHSWIDSNTSNIVDLYKRQRDCNVTPLAGFGYAYKDSLKSSTTANTLVATETISWVTATHASRSPKRVWSMTDATATSTCLTMQASGGAAQLGFFAATPISKPTTASGSAAFVANTGTAVNDASTFDGYTLRQVVKALRDFGLLT